jgi:MFS family permease
VTKTDPRTQNPWKIGSIILLAGIAIGCAQHKVPTLLILLMEKFSLDAFAGSWLMSIVALTGLILSLPVGKMIQRWGFKRLILAGLILLVFGSLLGVVAGWLLSPALLLVSRGIEGISVMVVSTCGPTAVAQCVRPERQGLAMGLWSNWGSMGGAIGMATTPFLWFAFGFTWVWSIFIMVAVVAALLVLVFVDDPQNVLIAAAGKTDQSITQQALPGRYRDVFTRDTVLFLYAFVCFSLGLLSLLTFLPSILQLQGVAPEISALPITLIQVLSMICVPLCGVLSDRTGRSKPILMITFFVFGLGVFLMFTNTGPVLWGAAALEGIVGFSCIGMFVTGWTKVLPRPELMPVGMGIFIFVQCLGQFLGSSAAQLLLGPDLNHWVFAGICLFIIVTSGVIALGFSRFK